MSFPCRWILGLVLVLLTTFLSEINAQTATDIPEVSTRAFKSPSGTAKPLTWWHWLDGHVTKEGIKKDLIDIQRQELGGVQLFNISAYPFWGPLVYGTERWLDHVRYAIDLCDSLGLEFYIMNSAGWSGAGGPWVSVEQSMKYVVWSEFDIAGSSQVAVNLPQPYVRDGFYKDIAILAVPAEQDGSARIKDNLKEIVSSEGVEQLEHLYDDDYSTAAIWRRGKQPGQLYIDFRLKKKTNIDLANLELHAEDENLQIKGGRIEVSEDGKHFNVIHRFNFENHVNSTANLPIPFNRVSTKFLRLKLDGVKNEKLVIREIKLRDLNKIPYWNEKVGMSNYFFQLDDMSFKEDKNGIPLKNVIDVTKFYNPSTQKLTWMVPKGRWTILRVGYTTTGKHIHPTSEETSGYEVDKLCSQSVAFHFEKSILPIIDMAEQHVGNTFKGLLFDSFEGGFQNWTENLPELFTHKAKYDLLPYLPVLTGRTVVSQKVTAAVLWDFRQVLTHMLAESYLGTIQKLAHKHGLMVYAEAEGAPMDPAAAHLFTDIPMNEFWTEPNNIDKRYSLIKHTTSIANIIGKPVVAAEAFTAKPEFGKWQSTPYSLKRNGDQAFTTGINRFVFHTYAHQPYDLLPGFAMSQWGGHFGRTNTWWEFSAAWIKYLSASQYLLQKGRSVVDFCFLLPEDARYKSLADQKKDSYKKLHLDQIKLPIGYQYDVVFPEFIKEFTVIDHALTLPSGASYKLLVLPDYPYMRYSTLETLYKLLKEGAYISGTPPKYMPDLNGVLHEQKKFDRLVKKIWDTVDGKLVTEKSAGKGKVFWGKEIADIIEQKDFEPDIIFRPVSADSLHFIHKKTKSEDIYFIANSKDEERDVKVSLRGSDRLPEIWNPETGETVPAEVFDVKNGRTEVPLQFKPYGSMFIVFRSPLPNKWVSGVVNEFDGNSVFMNENGKLLSSTASAFEVTYNSGDESKVITKKAMDSILVDGPWNVKFLEGRGAPDGMRMDSLKSWTDFVESDIRHYSGKVQYENTFVLPAEFEKGKEICFLNLGEMYDIAKVIVNGEDLGVVWTKPYRIDITSTLRRGENKIKIVVANRWINRLIGDDAIPVEDYRYDKSGKLLNLPGWTTHSSVSRSDKRHTFTTWKHYKYDDPLVSSGLIGPVCIQFFRNIFE